MTLFAVSIPIVLYHIHDIGVPLVVFAAMYGFRWHVGMWGNLLSLGAVFFSFLIAVGWWENLAYLLATNVPQMVFIADSIAFFTIFVVALSLLDLATRFMSSVKVKYAEMVENIGNGVALFLLSSAVCVTYSFAYHDLGPIGENPEITLTEGQKNPLSFQALRILSVGNLGAFREDDIKKFDNNGDLRELQLKRRQALMFNAMENNEGNPWNKIAGNDTLAEKIKK